MERDRAIVCAAVQRGRRAECDRILIILRIGGGDTAAVDRRCARHRQRFQLCGCTDSAGKRGQRSARLGGQVKPAIQRAAKGDRAVVGGAVERGCRAQLGRALIALPVDRRDTAAVDRRYAGHGQRTQPGRRADRTAEGRQPGACLGGQAKPAVQRFFKCDRAIARTAVERGGRQQRDRILIILRAGRADRGGVDHRLAGHRQRGQLCRPTYQAIKGRLPGASLGGQVKGTVQRLFKRDRTIAGAAVERGRRQQRDRALVILRARSGDSTRADCRRASYRQRGQLFGSADQTAERCLRGASLDRERRHAVNRAVHFGQHNLVVGAARIQNGRGRQRQCAEAGILPQRQSAVGGRCTKCVGACADRVIARAQRQHAAVGQRQRGSIRPHQRNRATGQADRVQRQCGCADLPVDGDRATAGIDRERLAAAVDSAQHQVMVAHGRIERGARPQRERAERGFLQQR